MAAPEWSHAAAAAGATTSPSDAWRVDLEDREAGESGSAQLRRHASGDARKRICLQLAHKWRYKSDCWSECPADCVAGERERVRTRRRAAGEDETQAKQQRGARMVGLFDRTFTELQMVQGRVAELLMPHISVAARAWSGPRSAVHYGRVRGEGMTWMRVHAAEGAIEVTRWVEAVLTRRLQALRSWRDALGEDGERELAYRVPGAYNSPESELDALLYIMSQSKAATDFVAGMLRMRDGGKLRDQDAAWLEDYNEGHNANEAMYDTAVAVMSRYRMESLRTYIAVTEAVVDGFRVSSQSTIAALLQRMEWVIEAAMSQGPAAGDKAQAKLTLPPLVDRLRLVSDDPDHGMRLLQLATTPPPPGQPLPRFVLAAPRAPGASASPPLSK
jgi:hypothetical protein